MENLINLIVALVLIFCLYIYLENKTYDVSYVKSSIDGNEYLVRNMEDSHLAADLLANIKVKLTTLTDYLANMSMEDIKKHSDKTDASQMKENIDRLKYRFRPDNISESTPNDKYTSYSVNKGEKIVFCLRNKDRKQELVKENIIIFVALHELSHVMTKSVGHTDEFWTNFQFLLKIAVKLKLYQNTDYNNNPVDYCGTQITDTPLKRENEIQNNNDTTSS